ncbi:MAG: hypothetical protein ACYDAS_02970 [Patescibacteria group bacterium]
MSIESIQSNQDNTIDTTVTAGILVKKEFIETGIISREMVMFPDGKTHSREYHRTEEGVLSKITDYYSGIGATESIYDSKGRIKSKIFKPIDGDSIEHRYDKNGRVTMEIRISSDGSTTTIKYTRDTEGNIIKVTSTSLRKMETDIFPT